jgi:hypothetical protein
MYKKLLTRSQNDWGNCCKITKRVITVAIEKWMKTVAKKCMSSMYKKLLTRSQNDWVNCSKITKWLNHEGLGRAQGRRLDQGASARLVLIEPIGLVVGAHAAPSHAGLSRTRGRRAWFGRVGGHVGGLTQLTRSVPVGWFGQWMKTELDSTTVGKNKILKIRQIWNSRIAKYHLAR